MYTVGERREQMRKRGIWEMSIEQALSESINRVELNGAHVGEAIEAVGERWR